MRALLGTASHFCEVFVRRSKTVPCFYVLWLFKIFIFSCTVAHLYGCTVVQWHTCTLAQLRSCTVVYMSRLCTSANKSQFLWSLAAAVKNGNAFPFCGWAAKWQRDAGASTLTSFICRLLSHGKWLSSRAKVDLCTNLSTYSSYV